MPIIGFANTFKDVKMEENPDQKRENADSFMGENVASNNEVNQEVFVSQDSN